MICVHMLDSSVGQQEGVPPFPQPTPSCKTQASPDHPGALKDRDEGERGRER